MITAAGRPGVPARWFTGDEIYGADPGIRTRIAALGLGHVLRSAATAGVPVNAGADAPVWSFMYVAGSADRLAGKHDAEAIAHDVATGRGRT